MKKRLNMAVALLAALAMVMTMSASVFAASVNSGSDALKVALKNAKLKKSQVKLIEYDYDDEDNSYEVEFVKKSNNAEYSYEISKSGKIREKSVDYRYTRNSSKKKIGKTAARKKVAKFSGISLKTVKNGTCYYEYDDGKGVYEIKFTKGSRIYEYDVLAPTGKIIEYSWKVSGY